MSKDINRRTFLYGVGLVSMAAGIESCGALPASRNSVAAVDRRLDVVEAKAGLGDGEAGVPDPEGQLADYVALNYDETNADGLASDQGRQVADYFREAMAAGGTQSAVEEAIREIQKEAADAGATVAEGDTLKLDQHQAWLVWCSDATNADFPTDTSDVFDQLGLDQGRVGKVWIQVPFAEGVPLRTKDTFSGCNNTGNNFWAVAVR